MKDRAHLALAFLAAALCDGALWPLAPMTSKGLAACLLALSLLLHVLSARRPGTISLRVQVPVLVAALIGLALSPTPSLGILAVALFVWARGAELAPGEAAGQGAASAPRLLATVTATAPGALALALFAVLVEVRLVGPVRAGFESLAGALNGASNTLTDGSLQLGPTALGLDLALLAFLLLNVGAGRRPWRSVLLRAGASGVVIAALLLGHALAFDAWIDATREFTREASEEGPGVFRGLLLLAPALVLLVAVAGAARGAPPARERIPLRALGACALLLVLPRALAGERTPAALEECTVLLVQTSPDDDRFDGPPHQSYGYYQEEGYRSFRRWLAAWGCEVRLAASSEIDAADFDGVDLAVYITPILPAAGPVEAYLDGGGAVLVLGDHTPTLDELARFNAVLEPFGLSYQFDSAFPSTATSSSLRPGASSMRSALRATPEVCYGVGASLRAGPAADVLLESRWAVGDRGFADSDALLGNRHYDHGDRLSDLPVVVSAAGGRGKLVVVGDTGPFVDSALPFSYPFVRAVVEEALTPPGRGLGARSLVILALALVLGYAGRRLAPLSIASLALGLLPSGSSAGEMPPAAERVVAIDVSLQPLTASLDRDPRTSVKGFAYQCAVNGRHPMIVGDLGAALAASPEVVVLISPARAPDAALRAELRAYVEAGGELWIAVGREEAHAADTLLAELGLRILGRPFGSSYQRNVPTGVRYREAWEVTAAAGVDAEVLLATFERPIVRRVARGAGHVTVFGDSYFLCDENVGTGEMTHEESERFLAQLLTNVQ